MPNAPEELGLAIAINVCCYAPGALNPLHRRVCVGVTEAAEQDRRQFIQAAGSMALAAALASKLPLGRSTRRHQCRS